MSSNANAILNGTALAQELETLVIDAGARAQRSLVFDAKGKSGELAASEVVRILSKTVPEKAPDLAVIDIIDARVTGHMFLAGAELGTTPHFIGCSFDDLVDLTNAKIVGIDFIACELVSVEADRIEAKGQIHIREANVRDEAIRDRFSGRPSTVRDHLWLCGAKIHGNLDLRGTVFQGRHLKPLEPVPLLADGISVDGSVLMSEGFVSFGEIRLNGGRIGRNLDLSGASLEAMFHSGKKRLKHLLCLSAAGAQISGSVYLRRGEDGAKPDLPFRARGTVRLAGAEISGHLDCSGGEFFSPLAAGLSGEDQDSLAVAIDANGVTLGGDAHFGDGFIGHGEIQLINAKLHGDLNCIEGAFDNPESDTLVADGVCVSGTAFFGSEDDEMPDATVAARAWTNGTIRAYYATFRQGVAVRGLTFRLGSLTPVPVNEIEGPPKAVCGISLPHSTISGSMIFRNVEIVNNPPPLLRSVGAGLNLAQSKADLIADDRSSWEALATFDVGGFEFGGIERLTELEWWRVELLDRRYASKAEFLPQPYLWLARVGAAAGYDEFAKRIRVHLAENVTAYGDYAGFALIGRRIIGATIAYGYSPFRAFRFLAVWTLLCMVIFWDLPNSGVAVASRPSGESALGFSPLIYALDTLVPIVDLHQKSLFTIAPPSTDRIVECFDAKHPPTALPERANCWNRRLLPSLLGAINPFIGWVLASLLATGLSGVTRRE